MGTTWFCDGCKQVHTEEKPLLEYWAKVELHAKKRLVSKALLQQRAAIPNRVKRFGFMPGVREKGIERPGDELKNHHAENPAMTLASRPRSDLLAAVHAAIKTRRITPKPKVKIVNGRRYHQIDPKATMAPPKKPGPKGPRKDK